MSYDNLSNIEIVSCDADSEGYVVAVNLKAYMFNGDTWYIRLDKDTFYNAFSEANVRLANIFLNRTRPDDA